jgi:quinol monooxygenase YgiN
LWSIPMIPINIFHRVLFIQKGERVTTNQIRAIAEVSIPEGKINEFRKLAAEIIARVEANEPNTLRYEWFLSNDKSKCFVVQIYKDSEAVIDHLGNFGDLNGPFHEVAPLTGLMIFGSPSDELRQTLEPIGAKMFEHWIGLTR